MLLLGDSDVEMGIAWLEINAHQVYVLTTISHFSMLAMMPQKLFSIIFQVFTIILTYNSSPC